MQIWSVQGGLVVGYTHMGDDTVRQREMIISNALEMYKYDEWLLIYIKRHKEGKYGSG